MPSAIVCGLRPCTRKGLPPLTRFGKKLAFCFFGINYGLRRMTAWRRLAQTFGLLVGVQLRLSACNRLTAIIAGSALYPQGTSSLDP